MIDWKNLQPFPRKTSTNDRERLAEEAWRKKKASHKGRNHLRNWERRIEKLRLKRLAEEARDKKLKIIREYKNQVHLYWNGGRADHPNKPK